MEACLNLREQGYDAGWIIFEDIWPLDFRRLEKLLDNKKNDHGGGKCRLPAWESDPPADRD